MLAAMSSRPITLDLIPSSTQGRPRYLGRNWDSSVASGETLVVGSSVWAIGESSLHICKEGEEKGSLSPEQYERRVGKALQRGITRAST